MITSDETRKKISKIKKEQNKGSNNPMHGKSHSKETRTKISVTRKSRASDPNWNVRPPCSKDKADKIRNSNLGRKWVHNPKLKQRKNLSGKEATQFVALGWLPGKGSF